MPKHSIDQSAAHAEAEMQAFLDASSGESHFEPVAETPSATEGSGDDPYDKELFEATWAVQSDPDAEPITNGEMTQFLTKAGITAEKMPAYKAFVAKQFSEDPSVEKPEATPPENITDSQKEPTPVVEPAPEAPKPTLSNEPEKAEESPTPAQVAAEAELSEEQTPPEPPKVTPPSAQPPTPDQRPSLDTLPENSLGNAFAKLEEKKAVEKKEEKKSDKTQPPKPVGSGIKLEEFQKAIEGEQKGTEIHPEPSKSTEGKTLNKVLSNYLKSEFDRGVKRNPREQAKHLIKSFDLKGSEYRKLIESQEYKDVRAYKDSVIKARDEKVAEEPKNQEDKPEEEVIIAPKPQKPRTVYDGRGPKRGNFAYGESLDKNRVDNSPDYEVGDLNIDPSGLDSLRVEKNNLARFNPENYNVFHGKEILDEEPPQEKVGGVSSADEDLPRKEQSEPNTTEIRYQRVKDEIAENPILQTLSRRARDRYIAKKYDFRPEEVVGFNRWEEDEALKAAQEEEVENDEKADDSKPGDLKIDPAIITNPLTSPLTTVPPALPGTKVEPPPLPKKSNVVTPVPTHIPSTPVVATPPAPPTPPVETLPSTPPPLPKTDAEAKRYVEIFNQIKAGETLINPEQTSSILGLTKELEEARNKYADEYKAYIQLRNKKHGFNALREKLGIVSVEKMDSLEAKPESFKRAHEAYLQAKSTYGQEFVKFFRSDLLERFNAGKWKVPTGSTYEEEIGARIATYKQEKLFPKLIVDEYLELQKMQAENLPPGEKSWYKKAIDKYRGMGRAKRILLSSAALTLGGAFGIGAGAIGIPGLIATVFAGQAFGKAHDLTFGKRREAGIRNLMGDSIATMRSAPDMLSLETMRAHDEDYSWTMSEIARRRRRSLLGKGIVMIGASFATGMSVRGSFGSILESLSPGVNIDAVPLPQPNIPSSSVELNPTGPINAEAMAGDLTTPGGSPPPEVILPAGTSQALEQVVGNNYDFGDLSNYKVTPDADNLPKIIEMILTRGGMITDLTPPGIRTHMIDNFYNQFENMSPGQLRQYVHIDSGDVGVIRGDAELDLSRVFGNKNLVQRLVADSLDTSVGDQVNIVRNDGVLNKFQAANPNVRLTGQLADQVIRNARR